MNKTILITAIAVVLAVSGLAVAQNQQQAQQRGYGYGMGPWMMANQGQYKGYYMGPWMMGAGMMGAGSMVATSDGGIIVRQGLELVKYDKDLNVVKSVDVKLDPATQKAVDNGFSCPWYQGATQNSSK